MKSGVSNVPQNGLQGLNDEILSSLMEYCVIIILDLCAITYITAIPYNSEL